MATTKLILGIGLGLLVAVGVGGSPCSMQAARTALRAASARLMSLSRLEDAKALESR